MRRIFLILLVLFLTGCVRWMPIKEQHKPVYQGAVFIPWLVGDDWICGENRQANILATILITAPWQERPELECNKKLTRIAQARAAYIATWGGITGHIDRDGVNTNEWVEARGYDLPSHYGKTSNNIESLAYGYPSAMWAMTGLLASPDHHTHIVGHGFYNNQSQMGVGYAFVGGTKYTRYYVIITAPPEGCC